MNSILLKRIVEVAKDGCHHVRCRDCQLYINDGCILRCSYLRPPLQSVAAKRLIRELVGGWRE